MKNLRDRKDLTIHDVEPLSDESGKWQPTLWTTHSIRARYFSHKLATKISQKLGPISNVTAFVKQLDHHILNGRHSFPD